MKKLFGNTGGLKAGQIRRLENLYRRRIPPQFIISSELAHDISHLSRELRRQIGLLINRQGKIISVIVGDYHHIVIPVISEYRIAPGRLKGLRCVHTHLNNEPLTRDDLTDLAMLRLDIMAAVNTTEGNRAGQILAAHLLPENSDKTPYRILPPFPPHLGDIGCLELIQSLESELPHLKSAYEADPAKERAILVNISTAPPHPTRQSLDELKALSESNRITVLSSVIQHRKKADPRFLMGRGKLKDISLLALTKGATMIVFDQELNPAQIRSITDQLEIKVIDRTQLILDIFAQRAQTIEGKLQVELAQLKYLLPRLITKNTAMSRLTGGIGGRGPGETKLEINRRRVRDRIVRLEKEVAKIKKHRGRQRARRHKRDLPVVSIIGYTNAGKSTLLNTLTGSRVPAENRLFATLDPTSRRLKFPKDRAIIITDTVGFIKNLPAELMAAFRATLEELESAKLFLHIVDISNPYFPDQIQSVEKILNELKLDQIPSIFVMNKQDLADPVTITRYRRNLNGIPICAKDKSTLKPLIDRIEKCLLPAVSSTRGFLG